MLGAYAPQDWIKFDPTQGATQLPFMGSELYTPSIYGDEYLSRMAGNSFAPGAATYNNQDPAVLAAIAARTQAGNAGMYTFQNATQNYTAQGVKHDNSPNAPAYQSLNPNDPNLRPTDWNGATNRDVLGNGKYGIRNWMNNHPLGVTAAFIAAAAGGAALMPSAGGGAAAGGAGTTAGAAGAGAAGAGAAGAGTAAGASAAGAALPEIVVTGTAGGLTAGQAAALAAGAGIGAATASGGLQPNSNPAGSFANANPGLGNAGNLASNGGITGGAGTAGGAATGANMGWMDWLGNNAGSLIGLAGGLASGGTKNQRVTTTNEPPAYLLPYLQNAAQGATGLYNQGGPQYYPGATLAPQSQNTLDALSGISARARAGSPLVGAAQNYVQQGLQQPISSNLGAVGNPYASPVATGSAANPYAGAIGTDTSANPYATAVGTNTAPNPYAQAVGTDTSANPYASAVTAGTQAQNPYASVPNLFGGATNPYLDATFDHALQKAQSGVESQYQRAGRNIGASAPVMGDIASSLATQIYAPAYESERNRQLQYQTQLNDIGSGAFENQQGRQLQSGLNAQNVGSQSIENARSRQLQSGLQAQGIGANTYDQQSAQQLQAALAAQGIGGQSVENSRARQLTAGLQGQSIGANTYDQQQAQALQAGLAGQSIGAQGFENAHQRQLSDIQSQRSFMDSLLGYSSPLAAQDYMDLSQLQGAGAAQDFYNQQTIDDSRARYDYGQNQPGQQMDDYIRRLTGLAGNYGTQTQNTPQYQNSAANALGYAMLLQQMQDSWRGS